jgi:hypothetical protein
MVRLVHYRSTAPASAKAESATLSKDISPDGLGILLAERLPKSTAVDLRFQLPKTERSIIAKAKVIWQDAQTSDGADHPPQFATGLQFTRLGEDEKSQIDRLILNGSEPRDYSTEATVSHLEAFFDLRLPDHVRQSFQGQRIFTELNQQQIMETIGLSPPFLKIQKIIIAGSDSANILRSRSLGMGIVTQADTEGHYNKLLSLALCGQLMASTAAIHLAALFPTSAPQAIEVNGIQPLGPSAKDLWKPSVQGTPFFAEASIIRKKMQLVSMTSTISFGAVQYGMIDTIKFVLLRGTSLSTALEIPA